MKTLASIVLLTQRNSLCQFIPLEHKTEGDGYTFEGILDYITPDDELRCANFGYSAAWFKSERSNLPNHYGTWVGVSTPKIRPATRKDFGPNYTPTSAELSSAKLQSFRFNQFGEVGACTTSGPIGSRVGFDLLYGPTKEGDGNQLPSFVRIVGYTSPTTVDKVRNTLDWFSKIGGWRYLGWFVVVAVMTHSGSQVFSMGLYILGWVWRRLKGDSAFEEGQDTVTSSGDEDGEEYAEGSAEQVILDYLVTVDDSKPGLRASSSGRGSGRGSGSGSGRAGRPGGLRVRKAGTEEGEMGRE